MFSPVWSNLPRLANLIGALSLAAGGLLLWLLADTWKAPWAGWAGLLLYPLFPLAITPLGSETPLYIALCMGAFLAYARKHYRFAAVCVALAALTRPDGLLVGVVLAGDFAIRYFRHPSKPPIPWSAILLFLGLFLPWFIFAWAYFGTPVPATLAAKQQQGAMAVSQRFARGFLTILSNYRSWRYLLEAVLILPGLVFVFWRARQWLLFLAWPVLYFAAYSILGVSRYFWYYTPLVPGFIILAGLGLQAIAGLQLRFPLRRNNQTPEPTRPLLVFHIPAAQTISIIILTALFIAQASGLPRLRQPAANYAIYRAAGEWLAAHTPAGAVIGTLEVGILGYYAHRPMVDFAGLIQLDVAAQLAGGDNYQHAALWAVKQYQPQYLALFSGDFPRLEQGYVAGRCLLEETFTGQQYRFDKDLDIYRCP
jgi:arabinofuranosyltransferase